MAAFVFTIPYILVNYHKYGSLLSIRILIVYSFILYLICVYFLDIIKESKYKKPFAVLYFWKNIAVQNGFFV